MIASNTAFAQIVRKIAPQSKLLRIWALKGGVSAQVTALEIVRADGQTQKMIVRQHGDANLKSNPQVAADEFRLLQILQSVGLAVPKAYLFDQTGDILPTPYVVIEYIEGETELAPTDLANFILQFATHLVSIHNANYAHSDLSFLPKQQNIYAAKFSSRPAQIDESLQEGRIRDALEAVWPFHQHNRSVLLHGDFWPGNMLWKDGRLVAVIDWEDAEFGDPLADLANSRLEILWAFGSDAMQLFTDQYRSMTTVDLTNLPYWDLCAALRPASKLAEWGLDDSIERRMRAEHRLFVAQAFEKYRFLSS